MGRVYPGKGKNEVMVGMGCRCALKASKNLSGAQISIFREISMY